METTRKRWLIATAVGAAWARVLVVLAVWSSRTGTETVRTHSELAAGRQTLDRAVETLRAEAGADAVVEVGPYQVSTGCRITLARQGTELDQVLTLAAPAGEEPQLLERLAQRAPEQWQARFNPRTGRFSADAGDFVRIVGEPADPGRVELTLSTGCRPGTDPALPDSQ